MYLYAAHLDDIDRGHRGSSLAGLHIDVRRLETMDEPMADAFSQLDNGDIVVAAMSESAIAGRLFVSIDREVYVPPLEQAVNPEGAYLWKLYVEPAFRQRGLATTLLCRAVDVLDRESEAETACALVALDNYPSRVTFEANGFEPRAVVSYLRAFGFEERFERDLTDDGSSSKSKIPAFDRTEL
jgi:GNAT superfamily N-acetyltransferase